MPLAPGVRLGTYEIESWLGSGAMGEVYRARDTRLERAVAIKVLADGLVDVTARRRFQREAQTASSLNHPHILTVHDVGELDGRQYLVTELVDGGTLRDWYIAQPRSWRQVVELLVGVADGLATAHAAGILHRDIKPDNVLVTSGGYAKLADFGLAKLHEPQEGASSVDPTLVATQTQPGMLVGTVAYMSPEQAAGRALDARSDVFSFGVLLYELLDGRRPFRGDTYLDVLQAIAHATPEELDSRLPQALRMVVEKALEKDPADRYQSMRELVVDLKRVARGADSDAAELPRSVRAARSARKRDRRRLAVVAAAIVAAGLIATLVFIVGRSTRSARPSDPTRYDRLTHFADSVVSPALSPDGRMLAYIRGDSTFVGPGEIYLQLLPDGEPVQLTDDGLQKVSPVFSPDGASIAYGIVRESSEWETWVVPVLGGRPRLLLKNSSGLNWIPSRDGQPRVLFSELTGESIHMALTTSTESRLEARRVFSPEERIGMVHRSYLSPDGRWVIAVSMELGWLPCRLLSFEGNEASRFVGPPDAPCTDAAWSPDGDWMYFSANNGDGFHTWRQRFPDGDPEQVTTGATEEQGLAIAADGRSFVTSIGEEQNTVWIHDGSGDRQITSQGYAYQPKFSPDGRRLYFMLRSGVSTRSWVSGELWTIDLTTGERQPLLQGFRMQDYDVSPDGATVVFSAVPEADSNPIWIAALHGDASPRRLDADASRAVFGPAGDVFFVEQGTLHRIAADGSGRRRLLEGPFTFIYSLSPDGEWVALWRETDVAAYRLDGGEAIELCSRCGTMGAEKRGVTPPVMRWSRDGKFLYLHTAWTTRETYAVPLEPGKVLPALPAGGLHAAEDLAALPGARRFEQIRAFPSDDPTVYAYMRAFTRRNIYRVAVP